MPGDATPVDNPRLAATCATCGRSGHGCPAAVADAAPGRLVGERSSGPAVYLGPVDER